MAVGHEQHASVDVASVQSSALPQASKSGDGQNGQQNPAPRMGGPCGHSTAGHVTPAQLQTGHWQGCGATSTPSGHAGAVHIAVGPHGGPPPEPLPTTPPVPSPPPEPLPATPPVPSPPPSGLPGITPLPPPEGCRDRPPQPAAQATVRASAPSEAVDLPQAGTRLPFRGATSPRMAGFPGGQQHVGAAWRPSETLRFRRSAAPLPRRAPTVMADTADLCGELPYKA
jgi:hypothetical protein